MRSRNQPSRLRIILRMVRDIPRLVQILWQEWRTLGTVTALSYVVDHVGRLLHGVPPPRYSRITPNIYLGGQYTASGAERLRLRGVTGVLNLRDEFDDAEAGIAPDLYLRLPTVDDTAPTLEQLCQGVRFMEEVVRGGGAVYVHCMLGVGRSATMVAAYFVAQGSDPSEAWHKIRSKRPFVQPTPPQQAQVTRFAEEDPCGTGENSDGAKF